VLRRDDWVNDSIRMILSNVGLFYGCRLGCPAFKPAAETPRLSWTKPSAVPSARLRCQDQGALCAA
jgi:hypothetical protein